MHSLKKLVWIENKILVKSKILISCLNILFECCVSVHFIESLAYATFF